MQPIIRGIEAVGSVFVQYRYNKGQMTLPSGVMQIGDDTAEGNNTIKFVDDSGNPSFVDVAGFRLDSNFLRANPQIASSFMIPILGGGAIALTNNNRSGTLNINCTRVSTPTPGNGVTANEASGIAGAENTEKTVGRMYKDAGMAIGPLGGAVVYDLVLLAQAQQAQEGGDSVGSTIRVGFEFCGLNTVLEFQGCTIASVDPIGLAGNDAVDYGVQINYLNWTIIMSSQNKQSLTDGV